MKKTLFVFCLLITLNANAFCPLGDTAARKNGLETALPFYTQCALAQNDDETQLMLARYYNRQKNTTQSLFYYHLAADNGNAVAQTELALLLLTLDKDLLTRQQILDYYGTVENMIQSGSLTGFKSLKITPYALLLLANEPSEQKWYYPSNTKEDPTASKHLKEYASTLSDVKKKKALQEVQTFKSKKLLDAAQSVLTPTEYTQFQQVVFPSTGQPDAFSAKQAMDHLKEKIESLQQK